MFFGGSCLFGTAYAEITDVGNGDFEHSGALVECKTCTRENTGVCISDCKQLVQVKKNAYTKDKRKI